MVSDLTLLITKKAILLCILQSEVCTDTGFLLECLFRLRTIKQP